MQLNILLDSFANQVSRQGGAIAIHAEDKTYSYEALDRWSNRIANYLEQLALPANEEAVVALLVANSPAAIACMLGTWKAGYSILPLDMDYPAERIIHILNEAGVKAILFEEKLADQLQDFQQVYRVPSACADGHSPTGHASVDLYPDTPVHVNVSDSSLAYVLFTSGTTGGGKGVLIEHRNISNYISWASNFYFRDSMDGSMPFITSLTFDLTLTSVLCPLVRGQSVYCFSRRSIDQLLEVCFKTPGIDSIKITPAHVSLLAHLPIGKTSIKVVIVGGEDLKAMHVQILRRINPAVQIYNEYGPTETTVGCTVGLVEENYLDIGKPIKNTRIFLLNDNLKMVPIGSVGEIYVSGAGVGRGYLSAPETLSKFVKNPYVSGDTLYKTGDLARWREDGNLEFFGRKDNQIKIRGYRIELDEIENAVLSLDGVEMCVVGLHGDKGGDEGLVCYFSSSRRHAGDVEKHLVGKLPPYMIPGYFVKVEHFPLSINGKIDRSKLPRPQQKRTETELVLPQTATEQKVSAIWGKVLATGLIDVHQNFFRIGGHSLKAMQVIHLIFLETGERIDLSTFIKNPTIGSLALIIDTRALIQNNDLNPSEETIII